MLYKSELAHVSALKSKAFLRTLLFLQSYCKLIQQPCLSQTKRPQAEKLLVEFIVSLLHLSSWKIEEIKYTDVSSTLMQYAVRIEMRDIQTEGANGGCSGLYLVVFKIMLKSVATLITYIP